MKPIHIAYQLLLVLGVQACADEVQDLHGCCKYPSSSPRIQAWQVAAGVTLMGHDWTFPGETDAQTSQVSLAQGYCSSAGGEWSNAACPLSGAIGICTGVADPGGPGDALGTPCANGACGKGFPIYYDGDAVQLAAACTGADQGWSVPK